MNAELMLAEHLCELGERPHAARQHDECVCPGIQEILSLFHVGDEVRFTHDGALGTHVPQRLRFYANGLFAVSRDRIRRRPREWYAAALARLSGRAPARCDGPDTRRRAGASNRLVGDCHVFEKAWHVVFGEEALMPPASVLDQRRAPNQTLRQGGRFYEQTPRGKCTVGVPPWEKVPPSPEKNE